MLIEIESNKFKRIIAVGLLKMSKSGFSGLAESFWIAGEGFCFQQISRAIGFCVKKSLIYFIGKSRKADSVSLLFGKFFMSKACFRCILQRIFLFSEKIWHL